MTLTEKLEKFALTAAVVGGLNFIGGLGNILYHSINAPRLDCREPLTNPINCVHYENDEQRSLAYTKNREQMYKAEKATGEWILFTSIPPLLLGASASGVGDYLRKRKKNDIQRT